MLECSGLVHVDPETVVLGLLVEVVETLGPDVHAFLVEPVHEHSFVGPHFRDQVVVVFLTSPDAGFDEGVVFITHGVVWIIIGDIFSRKSSINNYN